ncbi:SRPBCC family protein [Curtobacterium sp. PhB115]|uniref:SRPBCC family protein n=1 Tax=Curtobacterium sp. PhB115 TaxID=2485173 RepID=UPI0016197103|nr:SRPBCC family protein [Curtobacterium sp. PhB115]
MLIAAPVMEVFAFVADERNELRYNRQVQSVQKLTPGPIGSGTRWRITTAAPVGTRTVELLISESVPGRRISSSSRIGGMHIDGTVSFRSHPLGTELSWRWTLQLPRSLRPLAPLIWRIGQHREARIWASLGSYLAPGAEDSAHRSPLPWNWIRHAN